jgi:hypothetical protein
MNGWQVLSGAACAVAIATATAGGCGGGSGGATGVGGGATSGSSGKAASSGTGGGTTSASSAGTGGAGTGGGSSGCLDPGVFATLFTIEDPTFCAVASYKAAQGLSGAQPSWGSHGGPLTVAPAASPTGAVELTRWQPPSGALGNLVGTPTDVDAALPDLTGATPVAYLSQPAIDLGFFGLTAFAWTGAGSNGEIVLVSGTSVATRYPTNGTYGMAAVAMDSTHGRLLLTGETAPGDAIPPGTADNALYAADSCGTAATPELANTKDASCSPVTVAAWGSASGPAVFDQDGNAFVVMSSMDASSNPINDARAFAAASVARGTGPTAPTPLFTSPGYSGSLAALRPTTGADGIVAFQASTTFPDYADVVAQHYTATGATLQVVGTPGAFLKLASPTTEVLLFVDDQDRLWAGVPDSTNMSTTFVVIARATK